MKDYLNRDERRIATYFCIVYGLIDTVMNYKDNYSKKEITALKYVNTYLEKYIDALIARVGAEEGKRIMREATENVVEFKPKNYDGQFILDKESLEQVCSVAVDASCFGCKKSNYNNCELYKCMCKLGMSTAKTKGDECEFCYDPLNEGEENMNKVKNAYKETIVRFIVENYVELDKEIQSSQGAMPENVLNENFATLKYMKNLIKTVTNESAEEIDERIKEGYETFKMES